MHYNLEYHLPTIGNNRHHGCLEVFCKPKERNRNGTQCKTIV